jgi:hypothetical protein
MLISVSRSMLTETGSTSPAQTPASITAPTVAAYNGSKGFHITPKHRLPVWRTVHGNDPSTPTFTIRILTTARQTPTRCLPITPGVSRWWQRERPHHIRPSVHLTMGNPSNAIADLQQANNYLMEKPSFSSFLQPRQRHAELGELASRERLDRQPVTRGHLPRRLGSFT